MLTSPEWAYRVVGATATEESRTTTERVNSEWRVDVVGRRPGLQSGPLRGLRCELRNQQLEDALQLVHLYFEWGSPKYERAALRWLERYLSEGSPRLEHFAEITASLPKRDPAP
jgi:hypothetical protein